MYSDRDTLRWGNNASIYTAAPESSIIVKSAVGIDGGGGLNDGSCSICTDGMGICGICGVVLGALLGWYIGVSC